MNLIQSGDAAGSHASLVGNNNHRPAGMVQSPHAFGYRRKELELVRTPDVVPCGRFTVDHAVSIKKDTGSQGRSLLNTQREWVGIVGSKQLIIESCGRISVMGSMKEGRASRQR